ncbi:GHKL domain-containing protein [Brevibacillus choshinensis]|uniref:GHKL domain-containing protein n=2 Tax=Brevibacillus choshinensis TaxID=54911 RepID=A0ABX7FXI1_BRECH|nr:GHKL domain-containing protein [Brevibacillus choshinensis]
MVTSCKKNNRVLIILLVSGMLIFTMTCVSIAASYYNTIQSVRLSVANQSMKAASFVASRLDTGAYQSFLKKPVKDTEAFRRLEQQLAEAREQFGALYIYISKIDADLQGGRVMAAALPPGQILQIGEPCYINAQQISLIKSGQTYYSDIISDPVYGEYMSAGAPLLGEQGQLLGIVGVDMDLQSVNSIGSDVVKRSLPIFLFQGLFVAVLVFVILGLQRWYQRELKAAVGDAEQTYQDELRSVIASIRSIRHDFVNHMQVLYGLIECGYFDKAREYVQSLIKETKVLDITVRVSHPALMVLFHTKWEQAKSRHIVMQFAECPDAFEQIPSIDLVKILSNLIDNAMEAAAGASQEKWIRISCRQEENEYVFEVENTGPDISPEQMDKLFEYGFSTKSASKGTTRGAGLCIVSGAVKKHKGTIQVQSNAGITKFTVRLPIRYS